MAIYKDANGQWRNSDEAAYGDPGRVIAPPSWSGESAPTAPSPQTPQATAPAPTAPAPFTPTRTIENVTPTTTQVTPEQWVMENGQWTKKGGPGSPVGTTAPGILSGEGGSTSSPPSAPEVRQVKPVVYPPPVVQAPPDQTKDPADKKRGLVTSDGTLIEVPEIDYERIRQDLQRQHDEIVKQREFENELKTKESEQAAMLAAADKAYREALIAGQGADRAQRAAEAAMENERAEREIKVSEMLAEGDRAYKEALIAGQNADRAQKASEIAMENNYRQQLLYVQQQLQGQKLAIEQRSAQQERRRNRPFAPRPTVTAA